MCLNKYHSEISRLHDLMVSNRVYLNTEDDLDADMEVMDLLVRCGKHALHSLLNRDSAYLPYAQAANFEQWLEYNMKLYLAGKTSVPMDSLHLVIER